jgi:conjugative relaxase-like TrwC/TraI family protein
MDPRTGEVLIESKSGKNNRLEHRAGQDFTFSAPKSVSLLAVGNSEHKKMHDTAVARVLEHMEKNYSYARQTTDKVTKPVETGNLVIAKFGHFVSRELDPQLHTHAFFVNMTERQAGEWRATHNDMLNKDVKALGRLYRNELAHIYKDAGYEIEITDREKSFWEVKGVSKELIDDASKRSEQIDQRFSELRQMPEYAAWSETDIRQKATLDTRKAKDPNLDKAELRGMWERDFAARGETIEGVVEKSRSAPAAESLTRKNSNRSGDSWAGSADGGRYSLAVYRCPALTGICIRQGTGTRHRLQNGIRSALAFRSDKGIRQSRRFCGSWLEKTGPIG